MKSSSVRYGVRHGGFVVLVLLVQLFVRAHNIERQEVFVDEAYHITRAAAAWDFEQHPARASHGKLLLYFWLGIFEADPGIALTVARLATALFSLLNGAVLYLIGRLLYGHAAGLLALAFYAVLPLAFFFERITLADSFAAGIASLVVWRSWVLVRRPSQREGAILGLLLSLAIMAKLTMGLMPFFPVALTLIYHPLRRGFLRDDLREWIRRYWSPLITAASVVTLTWLPILIPAALALNTAARFILVDPANLQQLEDARPVQGTAEVVSLISQYTSLPALGAVLIGLVWLLWKQPRKGGLLLTWMLLIAVLPILAATLIRSRYMMPLAAPMALVIALSMLHLWQSRVLRWGSGLLLAGWLAGFALPFAYTSMSNPADLPLAEEDWIRYMSGNFSGDALRQAAHHLDELSAAPTYAVWGTCQLLYLYATRPVTCLPASDSHPDLALAETMQANVPVYVILNGDAPFVDELLWTWEPIARYPRPHIERPVEIWRVVLK